MEEVRLPLPILHGVSLGAPIGRKEFVEQILYGGKMPSLTVEDERVRVRKEGKRLSTSETAHVLAFRQTGTCTVGSPHLPEEPIMGKSFCRKTKCPGFCARLGA
jgi:hypothetical protein